ncbi:MAG: leucyl aminopeptidase [Pseudomonadota bacterium]|nr:leucyl aminopeptidase [Pseudomonadota bacterium]
MASKLDLTFSSHVPDGGQAVICLVAAGGTLLPTLDKAAAAAVIAAMSAAQFTGEPNKSLTLFLGTGVFVVIGTGAEIGAGSAAEEVGGRILSVIEALETKRACLPDQGLGDEVMADILMGMMSAAYHFEDYFTETPKKESSVQVTIVSNSLDVSHPDVSDRMGLMKGVEMARNLVFEPSNTLFPVEFATRCTALEKLGIEVSVLDEDAMAELGMGALLGVGQGSRRESRLVVMNWRGGAEEAPIALVGKGVTFDTGGISLKPAKGMEDMKFDMGGAAAVTGTMMAIASRKVARNVVGVIGLVENMPDGNAQRPGDVVTSMSGKTIEVINTDAEGRLVLADALHYTQTKFKPQAMVDLATLTGAMIVALGKEYAGVFSNSDGLCEQLSRAGTATLEPVWRMPLGKPYHQQLKSHIADIKNIGGPAGGSITAACFLERFVTDTPWAQLDIAGKAWADKATKTVPKGGTGYGVRLLSKMVDDWQPVDVTTDDS